MRVTIIKSDNLVMVDGFPFNGFDMSSLPDNFHALQWYGEKGEIESFDPITGYPVNTPTTDLSPFQFLIDEWFNKKYEYDNPPPEPPTVPVYISRRQCALQLMNLGMITGQEAVAMTKDGTPPALVQGYINALTEEQKYRAEIDFAATDYYRSNPLIEAMMPEGTTQEQLDQFFIAAAAL